MCLEIAGQTKPRMAQFIVKREHNLLHQRLYDFKTRSVKSSGMPSLYQNLSERRKALSIHLWTDKLPFFRITELDLNPFPNKPWFLCVCSINVLKTLREKEKLLLTSNFSFSHNVFYPLREHSAIFIKFKIVVCKLFHFGRVQNLSFGKGLNLLRETSVISDLIDS